MRDSLSDHVSRYSLSKTDVIGPVVKMKRGEIRIGTKSRMTLLGRIKHCT
jgi:hypothetical protein